MFRVLRDHDGLGVVCPSCRRMLRLPQSGEETPELVVPLPEKAGHAAEPGRRHHRRHRHRRRDTGFDEEGGGRVDHPGMLKVLMAVLAVLAIAVALVLLFPGGSGPPVEEAGVAPVVEPDPAEAAGDGLPDAGEDSGQAGGGDGSGELDVVSFDEVESRFLPVIKRFLEARDIDEMARVSREPERAMARMRGFYGANYSTPGFRHWMSNYGSIRDKGVTPVLVEDKGFRQRLVYVVEGPGDEVRVDWEAFVGWSEVDWLQLADERPATPVRLRARVKPVLYYNFDFEDEAEWVSFLVESPDDAFRLYGYARRGGEVERTLRSGEATRARPFLVDVSFPPGNPSRNQVLIRRAVSGWVDLEDQ